MAMNHQISSYDRYHGAVNAKELSSQKQLKHGNMRAEVREEGSKTRQQVHDRFERDFKPLDSNGGTHLPRGRTGEAGHGHDEFSKHSLSRNFDRHDFAGYKLHHQNPWRLPYGKLENGFIGMYGTFQGTKKVYQFTQITVTHSVVFSETHLGRLKKSNEAQKNFLDAARGYIQNPGEQTYKLLNDAMTKLMDPKFAPAIVGGAVKLSIRGVNRSTMAKFTMMVTPAPVKTLEEAREDLKNAYSSRRDGEKDIAAIRAEAYTNYIRALSEKFKRGGVISHTNNTPTTPVFKASVIYIVKVTQVNATSFHELKKPDFKHNFHGKLTFKEQRGFWNEQHRSRNNYVDMLRRDSGKSHIDKDFKTRKAIEAKHGYYRSGEGKARNPSYNSHNKEINHGYRGSGKGKVENQGHKRHNAAQTDKAS